MRAVGSAIFTALLLGTVALTEGASVSPHLYIAFGLGAFFTMFLGFALMSLAFQSAQQGYDDIEPDRAREPDPPN